MDSNDEEEIELKLRGRYSEKYSKNDLREALEKIRTNEMSFGAASKIYNVPKTTLHNKMRNPVNSPKGATTILSVDQENELADWILLHADFGDPRTKQDIILVAAEIASLDSNPSNHFKNGMPTSGWYDGFLKRHPLCSERTPQGISKASAINTRDDFAGLWRNIHSYFKKIDRLDVLNKPELWWNADETGFEKDKVPRKVVARRGTKRVSRREMGPPKSNTTVTYAFSAAGDYVEPLITLKDSSSSVAEIAFALGSVGANYGINQTESGWTKKESFYYFVSMHLHNQWEAKNAPKPRILTIDGYGAHFSLKLFRWCRLNGVIIVVLYPGATPFMQMCDTAIFGPLKEKHTQLYSQWRLKNPTLTMNEVEFVKLLKQINDSVIKKEFIINGWRATGLQPFNFNNLNTAGLLTKSSNRIYDFKGDFIESPEMVTGDIPKVNVISDVLLCPSSECFMERSEVLNLIRTENTPDSILEGLELGENGCVEIDVPLVEIMDMDEMPAGPIGTENGKESFNFDENAEATPFFNRNLLSEASYSTSPHCVDTEIGVQKHSVSSAGVIQNITSSWPDQAQGSGMVNFSELAGHGEIFQSSFETSFNLSAFGLSPEETRVRNASKVGKLVDTIRRDVKQLALLCAAGDREKLINVLVINQQLNLIDPPPVEQPEPTEAPRSINTILKPPCMPQRAKRKRNLNLKISYGVVTAKEVVDSITEREAADRQQESERELDEIAKHHRENEIKSFDDQLKEVRGRLSTVRAENTAVNKEIAQKKKNKIIDANELAIEEAAKIEREGVISAYDDQLRTLRDKLKDLRSTHVAANKGVMLKRKNYELMKKETGNKIQPAVPPPELDQSQVDDEECF